MKKKMIVRIINNLPEQYPDWAIRNALAGYDLPSHSWVQVEWNLAVAKAIQEAFEDMYVREGDHIAAWNMLQKADKYLNAQQTVHMNDGWEVAQEVISNLLDALALESELEWPHPFPELYRRRAFATYQEVVTAFGILYRKEVDARWFLEIEGQECPWYFILGTISRKRARLEIFSKYEGPLNGEPEVTTYEYEIEAPKGHFLGEVSIPKQDNWQAIWHIPREVTNTEYYELQNLLAGAWKRQGDKLFKSCPPPKSGAAVKLWPNELNDLGGRDWPREWEKLPRWAKDAWRAYREAFGRHRPDEPPRYVAVTDDGQYLWGWPKGVTFSHPEHPPVTLDGGYVSIKTVPGKNMFLGSSGPVHD